MVRSNIHPHKLPQESNYPVATIWPYATTRTLNNTQSFHVYIIAPNICSGFLRSNNNDATLQLINYIANTDVEMPVEKNSSHITAASEKFPKQG